MTGLTYKPQLIMQGRTIQLDVMSASMRWERLWKGDMGGGGNYGSNGGDTPE